jgi:hypothetical protein
MHDSLYDPSEPPSPNWRGQNTDTLCPPPVFLFGGRCLFEMEISMLELQEGITLLPRA